MVGLDAASVPVAEQRGYVTRSLLPILFAIELQLVASRFVDCASLREYAQVNDTSMVSLILEG